MKLNLILKMLAIEIILALTLTANQNVMKVLCFEFLSKIFTCSLTLRALLSEITDVFSKI